MFKECLAMHTGRPAWGDVLESPYEADASPWLLAQARIEGWRRRAFCRDVPRLLACEQHEPVVYFVRVGKNVKIGTSRKLRQRMQEIYAGPEAILAVVPGDRYVETAFHDRFQMSRIKVDGRSELFRLDVPLRLFLSRRRCRWTEVVAGVGAGFTVALVSGWFALGVVVCVVSAAGRFMRLGWEWS